MKLNQKLDAALQIAALLLSFLAIGIFFFSPESLAAYYDNTSLQTFVYITEGSPIVVITNIYDNTSVLGGNIVLTQGSSEYIYCNATVSDPNGHADITLVNASIFYFHNESSSQDNNVKYYNSSCSRSVVNSTSINARCRFEMWFYANPGTWTCFVTAKDGSGLTSSDTDNETIDPLFALHLNTTSINFGEFFPGQSSSSDSSVLITNFGNEDINISVDGYGINDGDNLAMDCASGNISIKEVKYSTTSGVAINSMTNLTDSPITSGIPSFTIDQNADDVGNSTGTLFWKINIPLSGSLSGQCNGTIVFSAVG